VLLDFRFRLKQLTFATQQATAAAAQASQNGKSSSQTKTNDGAGERPAGRVGTDVGPGQMNSVKLGAKLPF